MSRYSALLWGSLRRALKGLFPRIVLLRAIITCSKPARKESFHGGLEEGQPPSQGLSDGLSRRPCTCPFRPSLVILIHVQVQPCSLQHSFTICLQTDW